MNDREFYEKLAERLRTLRQSRSYTQPEIAEKIGIGMSAYRSYELCARRPAVDLLMKLAEIYGITMDEMLGIESKKTVSVAEDDFTPEQVEKIKKYAALVKSDVL